MLRKNVFIIIIFLAAVAGIMLWGLRPQKEGPAVSQSPVQLAPNEAVVALDYGNGQKRMFVGEVVGGMTILDAVLQSASAGNLAVETKDGEDGTVWVEEIDGMGPESGRTWKIYRDGQELDGLISAEAIEPGDRVELRYE